MADIDLEKLSSESGFRATVRGEDVYCFKRHGKFRVYLPLLDGFISDEEPEAAIAEILSEADEVESINSLP